jgi:class 3 adenylate cyclase
MWNDHLHLGRKIPALGSASYRLKVLLPARDEKLALYLSDKLSSYSLFVGDSLIASVGVPGKTEETTVPKFLPQVVSLDSHTDTLILTYWISNFHYWKGGQAISSSLGTESEIRRSYENRFAMDCVTAGGMLFFAISISFFFVFRRKDRFILHFTILYLMAALRCGSTNERILLRLLPSLSWDLLIRIEYLSLFIALAFLIIFLRSIWSHNLPKAILLGVLVYVLMNSVVCIATPPLVFSRLMPYNQWIIVAALIYLIYLGIKAVRQKLIGGIPFVSVMAVFSVFVIVDALYLRSIIDVRPPTDSAFLLMMVFMTVIIARRYSHAFQRVENIATELEETVRIRTRELHAEKEKSDRLLRNILPESIARRLKDGETAIADHFTEASIVFIDIADFTSLSARKDPRHTVEVLNAVFTIMDKISAGYGIEKIKTIGDCYMAAAGIPVPRSDHAQVIARMALDVREAMRRYRTDDGDEIRFRIGLDCGPIVAGVIGEQKFIYDLWGDAVNTASRMQESGEVDKIQITERFMEFLSHSTSEESSSAFRFTKRGVVEIKGKGTMRTWWLEQNEERGSRH